MKVWRSLWYKKVELLPPPKAAFSLQQSIQDRLQTVGDDWEKRSVCDRYDSDEIHVLNESLDLKEMFVGRLVAFKTGTTIEVCKRVKGAAIMPVHCVAPANDDEDFIPNQLYFGVRGNHCIVMQSNGLRTPSLQWWLNEWLTAPLAGASLQLRDLLSMDVQKMLRNVKKISIEMGLGEQSLHHPGTVKGSQAAIAGAASELIAAGLTSERAEELRKRLGDRSITARLELVVPERKRRFLKDKARVDDDVLDELAQFLAKDNVVDYTIYYNKKDKLKKDEVQNSTNVQFSSSGGSVALDDAGREMVKWLRDLQNTRGISAGLR